MKSPSPDTLRMTFGFCLLIIVAFLATCIALRKVEEQSSYGLIPTLTILGTLAGNFTQWAFQHRDDKQADEKKPDVDDGVK
jgi:hypothetical protein